MSSTQQETSPDRGAVWMGAALLAGALVFVFDLLNTANIVGSILFCAVILLAVPAQRRWFLWGLVGAGSAANVLAGAFGSHLQASIVWGLPVWGINRTIAGATLVFMGVVADFLLRSRRRLHYKRALLAEQNAQLETLNEELAAREEELFRQNEEMQAQNEELERQSEELRVANDELGRRERLLEKLLELSRAMAAETHQLTNSGAMARLCEAMAQLTDSDAAAILIQEDQHMVVRCHHGFGMASSGEERIPMERTFASLVMSRLQTGYIDDLALRADLQLPSAPGGKPYRSILATPLKVRGRLIGAVEVYAHEKRAWNHDQVALLESLAAQASVSLEMVDLFAAINEERNKFETVFRTLPLPVAVAEDPRCARVRVNPALSVLLNIPTDANASPLVRGAQTVRMQLFRDSKLVPESEWPLVRSVLRGEQVVGEEYELLLPSNERRTVLSSAAPIHDRHGRVAGGVAVLADVTMLKRLQQELDLRRRDAEDASLRKTRFLAAISHDIRTPTNAISLSAELLRRSTGNPALQREVPSMISDLQANARALGVLVNDLLDVARFDTGKVEFQETEFSVEQLISDEVRQLLPVAQDKGLRLAADGTPTGIWLRTDRIKLGRVVSNLVGNAIKFTEKGSISVSVSGEAGGGLRIMVRDTGVGIAPEHLARIFDEFTQLRNPERDRYKGTGLGLAISKRLVEGVGGTITVESSPGQGSTFVVHLPGTLVVPRAAASTTLKVGSAGGAALQGMRVLLVEDHDSTRWATGQILAGEGALVAESADGHEALQLLAKNQYDVVLLDMMLPGIDGMEVLRHLREQRPDGLRGIIVLTGDYTPERVERVHALGADELISKPIDVARLITLLQRFCTL